MWGPGSREWPGAERGEATTAAQHAGGRASLAVLMDGEDGGRPLGQVGERRL